MEDNLLIQCQEFLPSPFFAGNSHSHNAHKRFLLEMRTELVIQIVQALIFKSVLATGAAFAVVKPFIDHHNHQEIFDRLTL